MENHPKFKLAICGGGIAGLVCAVQLGTYANIDIEIYEAAERFSPVGAGIVLWPRTWAILEMMGLTKELEGVASTRVTKDRVKAWSLRKSDQPDGFEFGQVNSVGAPITVHRGDIHDVLLKHLTPACKIHVSKRIRSYQERCNGVYLSFEDGSTAHCDALIGADGINSFVRRSMYEQLTNDALQIGRMANAQMYSDSKARIWTGSMAYRALVSTAILKEKGFKGFSPTHHCGYGIHIVTYPVRDGELLNVGIYLPQKKLMGTRPPVSKPCMVDVAEIRSLIDFTRWEPRVQALLDCIDSLIKWPVFCVRLLDTYSSGHVSLIGDAAHAMLPHQASGAGQAIEDAHLLASLLGHAKAQNHNLSHILQLYSDVRRPFASGVWAKSVQNASTFALLDHGATENLLSVAETLQRRWEWAWEDRYMNDQLELAYDILQQMV